MRTAKPAPHFLRVTQALAFVSGLGVPLVIACGGRAVDNCDPASACEDASDENAPVGDGIGGELGAFGPTDGAGVAEAGSVGPSDAIVFYEAAGITVDGTLVIPDGDVPPDVAVPEAGDRRHPLDAVGGPIDPPDLPA